jgi:hypothetical protein
VDVLAGNKARALAGQLTPLYQKWNGELAHLDNLYEVRTSLICAFGALGTGDDAILLESSQVPVHKVDGNDVTSNLRMFSRMWLVERKHPAAPGLLLHAMLHEERADVRAGAATLLARAHPQFALTALRERLQVEKDPQARGKYIAALLKAGGQKVADEVQELLVAATGDTLTSAAVDLALSYDPRALSVLGAALQHHRGPAERAVLISLLAGHGGAGARNSMLPLLATASDIEAEAIVRTASGYEDTDTKALIDAAGKRSPALGAMARDLVERAAQQRQHWRDTR